jgi:cobyrinic acid a,c-diamide synthase
VARDQAFCFVYEDNLRLLREAGGELVEFSPLHDRSLPEDIGGIYLPGGYPELFATTLAGNETMKESIRTAIAAGMPVYAECGGLIYLTEGVRGENASSGDALDCHDRLPFVGIYPVTTRMLPKRKALGYREVVFHDDCLLGTGGSVVRGHEFHYSEIEPMPSGITRAYRVRRAERELDPEGYRSGNCLASYIHLHFGSSPEVAPAFVAGCIRYHQTRQKES